MPLRKFYKNKIALLFCATLSVFLLCAVLFVCYFKPFCYAKEIKKASQLTGIDQPLIKAIILVESHYKKDAISKKGAVGLMQILPSTALFLSEKLGLENFNLLSPYDNIFLGAEYVKYLLKKFQNLKTALAAYNAGEGHVAVWLCNKNYSPDGITLDVIPYPETRAFTDKILRLYEIYKVFT